MHPQKGLDSDTSRQGDPWRSPASHQSSVSSLLFLLLCYDSYECQIWALLIFRQTWSCNTSLIFLRVDLLELTPALCPGAGVLFQQTWVSFDRKEICFKGSSKLLQHLLIASVCKNSQIKIFYLLYSSICEPVPKMCQIKWIFSTLPFRSGNKLIPN